MIPCKKAITVAPTIGIPYGLTKNPIINASIPSDTSFCINEPIAATIHISIKKYRIVVPMPSINVKKAVRILSSKLIGNKIIFIIHLIISYSSLPNSPFVSPHTISMQT
ncbi:LSU ribosomal protein L18P [Streptococcus dysgalactiae subsp. equisimilis RE378]|nr:LSU ribosomal protein L18P [Streptococcus dysgalactiae subsp. equisimilis RE378]